MHEPIVITDEEIEKAIKRCDEKKLLLFAREIVTKDCIKDCINLDLFKEKIKKCDLITRARILKYILSVMDERGL